MFSAVSQLTRYVACPAQSKRFYMIWCAPHWCPSNLTSVFAFEDDASIGILTSAIHTRWATHQSTKLETRPRYTVATLLTFPWPAGDVDDVAATAGELIARRGQICVEQNIGLTKLYNQVDDGAWADPATGIGSSTRQSPSHLGGRGPPRTIRTRQIVSSSS